MPEKLTYKRRKVLEPYEAVLEHLCGDVARMSNEDLEELRDAASAASSTNCWWGTYQIAQLMLMLVRMENQRRGTVGGRQAIQEGKDQ